MRFKRKRKVEGRGKEKGEKEMGSEALAETERVANARPGIEPGTPATAADALPGSIPGRGICDFFHFCQSFTSNFLFSFPFLFIFLSSPSDLSLALGKSLIYTATSMT